MIKPYIINDHKTQGEWKIQLTMTISFMSTKDSDETSTMHTKSNNIEIIIGNETAEIIRELFESRLQRHQKGLEESMRESEFLFSSIDLLCYKLHKISLDRGGLYKDSSKWIKIKRQQ